MNKSFYTSLALSNIRKNSLTYIPYIIVNIGLIILMYNAFSLTLEMDQESNTRMFLTLSYVITGIFSIIFIIYANSFLIKRRKKELGLFHILGMEKKHIAKTMTIEHILVSIVNLFIGLILAVVSSKLISLVLYKLIQMEPSYDFFISSISLKYTIALFSAVYLLILIVNIFQVYRVKPIDLLRGSEVGEKEPKINWVTTLLGIIFIGIGYFLALSVKHIMTALAVFMLAAILVIIGTYFLFTGTSVAILKLMKSNKKFYYQTSHFINISSMIYRMKQNAASLANICIITSMILVSISTTFCLYMDMEAQINNRVVTDTLVSFQIDDSNEEPDLLVADVYDSFREDALIQDLITFEYSKQSATFDDFNVVYTNEFSEQTLAIVITMDELKKISDVPYLLAKDEVAVYYSGESKKTDTLSIQENHFKVKKEIEELPKYIFNEFHNSTETLFVVVKDTEAYNKIEAVYPNGPEYFSTYNVFYNLDNSLSDAEKIIYSNNNRTNYIENDNVPLKVNSTLISSKQELEVMLIEMYGSLLFLGCFLGFLFIMMIVLIIYYKQINEGHDDRERYQIMQKVGLSKREIKKAISSQILMIFFIPVIVATIHVVVACPIIIKILAMMGLSDPNMFYSFMFASLIVFITIYGIIYALTARTYYKIVNTK